MSENNITIDNIQYYIEKEELEDIEYYEILSLEDIVKDNPTFIAFSRDEIYNELYDFFKNKGKSINFTNLIYDNFKLKDITNYILIPDATKKDYECSDENIIDLIKNYKQINKSQYNISQIEKNKLFFALTYDEKSEKVRYKPYMKTIIELIDNDKNINIYYPIYPSDDTNIPILSAYYKVPKHITNDYIEDKILSRFADDITLNIVHSNDLSEFKNLIEKVKPAIEDILEYNREKITEYDKEYMLDYNGINNIMEKFDMSLDTIKLKDYKILLALFSNITNTKVIANEHNKYKIINNKINNEKIEFYNNIQNIVDILKFTDIEKLEYDDIIIKMQEELININSPPLLYNNINDIINAVTDNTIDITDIIENLEANKKSIILKHSIDTLNDIRNNDTGLIIESLDKLTNKFVFLKNAINDISKLHFIDFYKEIKEIREGNDDDDYEGIPDVYKNEQAYEGIIKEEDENIYDFANNGDKIEKFDKELMNKYLLSIKYRDSKGFIEGLKIILRLINKVHEISKLQINYDLLCDELFTNFSSIPSKYDIFKNDIMNDPQYANDLTDSYIKEILKIKPENVINYDNNAQVIDNMPENIMQKLYDCNIKFINNIYNMLYLSIAWWSIQIQDDIINDNLLFNIDLYQVSYIDKWSLDGAPYSEKDTKKGVLVYLSEISKDVMMDENTYMIPDKIIENSLMIINSTYKNIIDELRVKNIENKKKVDKGKKTHLELVDTIKMKQFDKLVNNYVEALLYMPSFKYKKIHKFLLGCCLQKIDSNFKPDIDLIGFRNDLLAAKNKYAKYRETSKPRGEKFIYYKAPVDSDYNDILKNFVKPTIYIEKPNSNINVWLDQMYNVSPLLPNDTISEFKINLKSSNIYIQKYLKLLVNTSGYKKNNFEKIFLQYCDNKYKQILNYLCVIFEKYKTDNENELNMLNNSIIYIRVASDTIKTLNLLMDENTKDDIIKIRRYIITRALCLPFNPDSNDNILVSLKEVNINFVSNITKQIHNDIMKYLENVKMPTAEENLAYVNELREQNKNKTLAIMNTKTQDERDLITQLKNIGIKYVDNDDDNKPVVNEEIVINDDDGEEDFIKKPEDEGNDDDLDEDNYGFLYT